MQQCRFWLDDMKVERLMFFGAIGIASAGFLGGWVWRSDQEQERLKEELVAREVARRRSEAAGTEYVADLSLEEKVLESERIALEDKLKKMSEK